MLQTQSLKRRFVFKKGTDKIVLDDPNPLMSAEEVLDHYTPVYPEFQNAMAVNPTPTGDNLLEYEIQTTVGTKG